MQHVNRELRTNTKRVKKEFIHILTCFSSKMFSEDITISTGLVLQFNGIIFFSKRACQSSTEFTICIGEENYAFVRKSVSAAHGDK